MYVSYKRWLYSLLSNHGSPDINRHPSSVYVVYQPIHIFDNCRQWVGSISPLTASFRSDTLSTLEYKTDAPPATKVMNYADLPCPPPAIAQYLNPEVSYSPILNQLFRTYDQPPNTTTCQMAGVIDPPVHAVRVDQIAGPKDGGDTIA